MIPEPIQYRSRCCICGWDGLDIQLGQMKIHFGTKTMSICPKCNGRRDPQDRNKSCITHYAVHETCGRAHDASQPCPR